MMWKGSEECGRVQYDVEWFKGPVKKIIQKWEGLWKRYVDDARFEKDVERIL